MEVLQFGFHPICPVQKKNQIRLEKLLKHSNLPIKENNFSCEGGTEKNVGAVIGSMYDVNSQNVKKTWCLSSIMIQHAYLGYRVASLGSLMNVEKDSYVLKLILKKK